MSSIPASNTVRESRRNSVAQSTTDNTLPTPPNGSKEDANQISGSVVVVVDHRKDFGFLPIPKRLRYDPARPAHFGLLMNVIFGVASTFIAGNLYYCQALLSPTLSWFDASQQLRRG